MLKSFVQWAKNSGDKAVFSDINVAATGADKREVSGVAHCDPDSQCTGELISER